MELGARALGARSIVARADSVAARDDLNLRLKRRVWYQPFCPSMLESEGSRVLADWTGNRNHCMTMAFEVARWSYFASFDDPVALLQLYAGDNTNNYVGYRNPEYDRLLLQSNVTPDPVARRKLLEQAEAILVRDAPIIPIFDYVRRYLVAPTVDGWVTYLSV